MQYRESSRAEEQDLEPESEPSCSKIFGAKLQKFFAGSSTYQYILYLEVT